MPYCTRQAVRKGLLHIAREGHYPPVRRRVACWSKEASTRWHKKSLVSGTMGAFRLCTDERTSRWTYREQCQADTMPLSLEKFSTAGTNDQDPSTVQSHSGNVAAAKQASLIKQQCKIKHQNLRQPPWVKKPTIRLKPLHMVPARVDGCPCELCPIESHPCQFCGVNLAMPKHTHPWTVTRGLSRVWWW